MHQAKFSIDESQIEFLNRHDLYGFKDKSTMVREALERLRKELERERLKYSAELYAEIYEEDAELQSITDAAITGWPE